MFADPKKNIEQLRLSPGALVADFGSGSGHYAFALRDRVGPSGKIFAVDIQKDLLISLKNEAGKKHVSNIEVVWGDVEKNGGSRIKDGVLDAVVISNLIFQVEDKGAVAKEASRVVKTGGALLAIDWSDSFAGLGPAPEAVVTKAKAIEIFEKAGFLFEREIDAGAHHYGIILKKV
jgi:ubiquinone/menaquinone biosynthesis C-methylase UbiE